MPHRYGKLTCHIGSHSVTCHPTEVRIPPVPPAEASTRFSDSEGMQGWVDLCYVNADQPGLNLRPANCKSNSLPLSHRATRKRYWLAGVKEVGDKQTLRCYWWSRSGSRAEPHRGCRIWWAQRQSWSHAQASCCSRVHTHAWDCAHSNVCANADGGCHWHADRHTWQRHQKNNVFT